ncbi:MAG: c-type cytochrome [Woeseiaceae bacterium]
MLSVRTLSENVHTWQREITAMNYRATVVALSVVVAGCATAVNPLDDYEELDATTILDAPTPGAGNVAPQNRESVARGEYLVELLGCGVCHTDGALIGEPRSDRSLAGSRVGIAYTNPLEFRYPGVAYPPNITPDEDTGIGSWSNRQIANAIRSGIGRHGTQPITVMPWQAFAKLTDADVNAIVGYLRHIDPVKHRVPENTPPGRRSKAPYVHFGVYRPR